MKDIQTYNDATLLTVAQMAEHPKYPWLTERALRHYIHDAEARTAASGEEIGGNGFNTVICRLGRKILIDVEAFERWVRSHQQVS